MSNKNKPAGRRTAERRALTAMGVVALAACSSSGAAPPGEETTIARRLAALAVSSLPASVDCGRLPVVLAVPGQVTNGTLQAECIVGTPGRDVIAGRGGNDRIFGLGGADEINAGRGDDLVFGGPGADQIAGGVGNDLLHGEGGQDTIRGGPGDDIATGGPGADDLRGGNGNDSLFGGRGQDSLGGGAGEDYLDGRQGADTLAGGPGDDELVGGPGRDALVGGAGFDFCNEARGTAERCERASYGRGSVIVANRAGRSLSVIDVLTDTVVRTVPMPNNGEPTYLAYSPQNRYLFVADRQNSAAVVFDAETLTLIKSIAIGRGVFHCWIDRTEGQLWVTNDSDKTASVIDTRELEVLTTINMPADLDSAYIPHDVTLGRQGDDVYITLIGQGQPDLPGVLLRYSSLDFEEKARRSLGGDPHVSLRRYLPEVMYVFSQGANLAYIVDRETLVDTQLPLAVPNAHGSAMNTEYETDFVYTTNIAGGGVEGLVTIDTATQTVVAKTDTPLPVPHNLALDFSGSKLYATHSGGSANQVSVYSVNTRTGVPTLQPTAITVGLNPFGLTVLPLEYAPAP